MAHVLSARSRRRTTVSSRRTVVRILGLLVLGADLAPGLRELAARKRVWVSRYQDSSALDFTAYAVGVSLDGVTVFVTGVSGRPDGVDDYSTVAFSASTGAQQLDLPLRGRGSLRHPWPGGQAQMDPQSSSRDKFRVRTYALVEAPESNPITRRSVSISSHSGHRQGP